MRFCLVADESVFEPPHGGIAIWVRRMIEVTQQGGHECVVVTRTSSGRPRVETYAGCEHHFLSTGNVPRWVPGRIRLHVKDPLQTLMFAYRAASRVRALEYVRPFDLVVFSSSNGPGVIGTRWLNSPTSVRWAAQSDPTLENPRPPLARIVKTFVERRSARQADVCLSNSASLLPLFAGVSGSTPVVHLPQPVFDVTTSWADPPAVHAAGGYILFFAKGLTPIKGPDILAQALPDVIRAHPNLMLCMVGDDRRVQGQSMRARVLSLAGSARSNICFLEFLEQPRLYPLIHGARAVVIPSIREHVSHACLEALSLGRPVVGTTGNGMEDVIRPGLNGELASPGDPKSLATAILRCLKLDLRRVARTSEGVLAGHSPSAVLQILEEVAIRACKHKIQIRLAGPLARSPVPTSKRASSAASSSERPLP